MAIYQLLLSLSAAAPQLGARDNRSLQRLTETIDWAGLGTVGITHTARSTPNTLDHSISIKTVAAISFLLDPSSNLGIEEKFK